MRKPLYDCECNSGSETIKQSVHYAAVAIEKPRQTTLCLADVFETDWHLHNSIASMDKYQFGISA